MALNSDIGGWIVFAGVVVCAIEGFRRLNKSLTKPELETKTYGIMDKPFVPTHIEMNQEALEQARLEQDKLETAQQTKNVSCPVNPERKASSLLKRGHLTLIR